MVTSTKFGLYRGEPMPRYFYFVFGLVAVATSLAVWLAWQNRRPNQVPATPSPVFSKRTLPSNELKSLPESKTLNARDVAGVEDVFQFQIEIPKDWQVEAIQAIEAVNIYDPAAEGDRNLDKSQIFIRHFKANDFLILPTVDILERSETKVNDRPAVRYVIEKKADVTNFANQPTWRNQKHVVTDVRVSDANPSIFYVIAKRPELDDKIYNEFLASFQVVADSQALIEPVQGFKSRITKKPFGIFVTPQNSPVQPERFTGYHTGVDAESDGIAGDVPVKAIADGQVLASQTADGYGGVIVLRHQIKGENRAVIYGHLDPRSMLKKDTIVKAGDQIAILGDGFSPETDNERQHLHLAILKTEVIDLRGYVQKPAELENWLNLTKLF